MDWRVCEGRFTATRHSGEEQEAAGAKRRAEEQHQAEKGVEDQSLVPGSGRRRPGLLGPGLRSITVVIERNPVNPEARSRRPGPPAGHRHRSPVR